MTVQYCSDLHLEFKQNKEYLTAHPITQQADILILAGDIIPFSFIKDHTDFFRYVSKQFKYTYWLPGNHEYYGTDVTQRGKRVKEKIRNNVFLVNNLTITHEDVRFIFSTLWTNISPANEWVMERSVNDFHQIRYGNFRLSVPHFNQLHQNCLSFLTEELHQSNEGKTIVVTHHVPTFFNYPSKYKGSLLNEAFGVELYPFIEDAGADCWLYGHHHCNIPEFAIGKTRLLTNQLGYVQQGEHRLFDGGKTLTI